jgi:hypothetical protein
MVQLLQNDAMQLTAEVAGLVLGAFALKSSLAAASLPIQIAVCGRCAEIEQFLGRSARALLHSPNADDHRVILARFGLDLEVLAELSPLKQLWSPDLG